MEVSDFANSVRHYYTTRCLIHLAFSEEHSTYSLYAIGVG